MSSSLPLHIAETIQTASINRAPSPSYDLNPSTAASKKEPVILTPGGPASDSSLDKYAYDDEDGIEQDDEEDIPYGVLKPTARRQSFGPLPDLRFEQSYLASIAGADTKWKVIGITIRDQIFMPLMQGMIWSLALHGWRYWNRSTKLSGTTTGARIRRWWYAVNDWPVKDNLKDIGNDTKLADNMGDYYQNQSSSD